MANVNKDREVKYGIDKDIAAALDAKFNQKDADECIKWIAELSGDALKLGNIQEALKSGASLCRAINKLSPNAVPKINSMNAPFMCRENINNFLEAARKFGVRDSDLFVTGDLFEGTNLVAVVDCIRALNGRAIAAGIKTTQFGISSTGEKNVDNFKFEVKATGDTNALSKQTSGSIEQKAEKRTDGINKMANYQEKNAQHNSQFQHQVSGSGTAGVATKQTSGSVYQGSQSVQSDKIIKTQAKAFDTTTATKQTSGSIEQKAEKRTDSIVRLGGR